MTEPLQQEILRNVASILNLSPDVRLGQLLAHLGFLGEDMFDRTLWHIEDEDLAKVVERHLSEMAARETNVA